MIRTREELAEKLGLDDAEDQHTTIMNNMVDARACYKPSGKVSAGPLPFLFVREVFNATRRSCSDDARFYGTSATRVPRTMSDLMRAVLHAALPPGAS